MLTIDNFATEWIREVELTEKVLNTLTDESLSQEIVAGKRTLGQLAWHLVNSLHFMTSLGLTFDGPAYEHAPASAEVICKEYQRISHALLEAIQTQWTDESLQETKTLFGAEWSNGSSLRFTIMHQAHHRGQMTVLMRQAGLCPPEIYGPTYETWVKQGVTPLV